MKYTLSSSEQMRQLINEVDNMSRRNFLKKGTAAAVSAVANPKVGIGSLGSSDASPETINDRQKLASYIVDFLKSHKDQGETHPVYDDLVDYSKGVIAKLKTGWTPSKEELTKVWTKQSNLIRDLYPSGAEDPGHDWFFNDDFFGYSQDDLEKEMYKVHGALRKIEQSVPSREMTIPKQRSEYYKKITDQYANMLKSDEDVPSTIEEMDEDLKNSIIKVLTDQGNSIETISAEELKIILSKMDYNTYDNEWTYHEEDDETYEYNPAENAYLDIDNGYSAKDMLGFLNIPYDPKEFELSQEFDQEPEPEQLDVEPAPAIDTEPTQTVGTQPKQLAPLTTKNNVEPELDNDKDDEDDKDDEEDPKDKKLGSATESIRHYIEVIEKINKKK